jgi:hypothetical protein
MELSELLCGSSDGGTFVICKCQKVSPCVRACFKEKASGLSRGPLKTGKENREASGAGGEIADDRHPTHWMFSLNERQTFGSSFEGSGVAVYNPMVSKTKLAETAWLASISSLCQGWMWGIISGAFLHAEADDRRRRKRPPSFVGGAVM